MNRKVSRRLVAFVSVLVLLVIVVPGCSSILNRGPIAYIDAMKPQEIPQGETVWFKGHGEDPDGSITTYQWRSSIDGQLSSEPEFETKELSKGTHTIYFRVRDDQGVWSEEDITTVKVEDSGQPAVQMSIDSFQATPEAIADGDTAKLTWKVTGASRVVIEPGIGNVPLAGSRTVSPTTNTTYMLTAYSNGQSVWASTQVHVSDAAYLPTIKTFTASPSSIRRGEKATLDWEVTNADTITITSSDSNVSVLSSGKAIVMPTQTTLYQLTATNKEGATVRIAKVTVKASSPQDTVILLAIPSEGGYVDDSGSTGSTPRVGDDENNRARQGFISFDISGIPQGSKVVSAALDVSSGQRTGQPFEQLGAMRVYAHQYGRLSASDFSKTLPSSYLVKYENRPVGSFTSTALFAALQDAIDKGESRFQIRIQFEKATDGDYSIDSYRLEPEAAVLVVTYQ